MPHYKDGTEAKVGDLILAPGYHAKELGVVLSINPGSTTCNLVLGQLVRVIEAGSVRTFVHRNGDTGTYTCGECERLYPPPAPPPMLAAAARSAS